MHLLIFHKTNTDDKKARINIDKDIYSQFQNIKIDENINMQLNMEQVKSCGSYINYLKKNPYYLFTDDLEVAQMYVHFDRTHIFPENSRPKFSGVNNYATSGNQHVLAFFNDKLKDGCIDLEMCLQDPRAVNYLANTQLKVLFSNAQSFFFANRKFIDSILEITNKFVKQPMYKKCICPVIEMLQYQNINIQQFEENFMKWLLADSKKNTLIFIGPPDTGKSVFASSLHNCFRYANRLANDGLFTFANAINADCIYHEEPFITQETMQTAKLIYEGNPSTPISIKNLSAKRLNKKIPVIISTNHPITKYCSSEEGAINARCHSIQFKNNVSKYKFCNDNNLIDNSVIHTCSNLSIDIKRRTNKATTGESSIEDFRQEQTPSIISQEVEINDDNFTINCDSLHKLHKCHWIAYITYIVFKYNLQQYYPVIHYDPTFFNKHSDLYDICDKLHFDCSTVEKLNFEDV
uniref:NS1 protein n=1 Tax=Miniopterus bat parvovirus TaxID=3141923 RepID=A0AAU7E1K9_9VIRU